LLSLFITFEGPEGSGKTVQAKLLYAYLKERGYAVILTREPGGTAIGDQVRSVLLSPQNTEMRAEAEILLFSASRAQLVRQVIRPHLEQGDIVICDRYADSTLAYQGYGLGLDLDTLKAITAFATGGLKPDLTLYLDVDVEEGLRRRHGQEWNRLDAKDIAYHRRVRHGYLELIKAEPQRWVVLDGARAVEQVQREIQEVVSKKLAEASHETRPGHRPQR